MRLNKYWISAPRFTGQVDTVSEEPFTILAAPPVWRKFVGQPMKNLIRWLRAIHADGDVLVDRVDIP